MTKEEIQEAAEHFSGRYFFGVNGDIANSEYCFKSGAEWRINSVWHYDKKPPKICEPILLGMFKGYIVLEIPSEEYWNTLIKDHVHVQWAYVKDLIP